VFVLSCGLSYVFSVALLKKRGFKTYSPQQVLRQKKAKNYQIAERSPRLTFDRDFFYLNDKNN